VSVAALDGCCHQNDLEVDRMPSTLLALDQLPIFPTRLGAIFSAALASPWVTYILVPVFVTLGAVLLKAGARPEFSIKPEDKVVGFDLGITACVTLLVSGFLLVNKNTGAAQANQLDYQNYLIGIFILLFLFVVALAFGAWQMGRNGWDTTAKKPKPYWLTAVNGGGALLLIIAFILTGGSFK
jgi:hypothetical protein